jgi:hypothetical protein
VGSHELSLFHSSTLTKEKSHGQEDQAETDEAASGVLNMIVIPIIATLIAFLVGRHYWIPMESASSIGAQYLKIDADPGRAIVSLSNTLAASMAFNAILAAWVLYLLFA